MLSLTIIKREQDLFALQRAWDELFERALNKLPFLRFDWIKLCWERQRADKGVRLFVLLLREDDRIVLIAPLVLRRRLLVFRTLCFLDSLTPQYNDVLVEDCPAAESYVSFVVDALRRRWSLRSFRASWLREDSLLWKQLQPLPLLGGADYAAPFIDLRDYDGSWERYLDARSRRLRVDHNRQSRRLTERGISFHFNSGGAAADGMAWLFDTKLKQMGLDRSSSAWIARPETERLFRAAAQHGSVAGHAWQTALSEAGKPIAMCLAFVADGTLFISKITYDPDWENYSPGRTLFMLTIKEAFDRGLQRCDMMVGEAHYKNRIADGHVRIFSRRVSLRGPTKSRRGLSQ